MKRTLASTGTTIAIVAIAIGLAGCGSSPSSNNAASKTLDGRCDLGHHCHAAVEGGAAHHRPRPQPLHRELFRPEPHHRDTGPQG